MKNKVMLKNGQNGVVLIVSLIILLVMTLMSLTGMKTANLEEKMAGNMRDQNIAFQAAEAALRDAESDIFNSGRISGLTNMNATCNDGMCYGGRNGISTDTMKADATLYEDNAEIYGTHTTSPAITGLANPPKYLVVGAKIEAPGSAAMWKYAYQITAYAQGKRSTTKVVLNEVYVPY